jgi:hypothetical protein
MKPSTIIHSLPIFVYVNLIRNELFEQCKEENVRTGDIISARHALYRERRKRFPKLPESREEVNTALENLRPILTNKGEDFVLINDSVSGIVIFGTLVNLTLEKRERKP